MNFNVVFIKIVTIILFLNCFLLMKILGNVIKSASDKRTYKAIKLSN